MLARLGGVDFRDVMALKFKRKKDRNRLRAHCAKVHGDRPTSLKDKAALGFYVRGGSCHLPQQDNTWTQTQRKIRSM